MKYPQLVSTRAVSAISDWLVTQLEQLGVDASLVYSRLLLSLLHTPLQINALDLAEISEMKVGTLARNKVNADTTNYRRFSAADTEALKRLAAIDSLLEAVSSDQKLSKIETLIDELSEKLREIERQNHADDSIYANDDDAKLNSTTKDSSVSEDPAKRYYSAFPALSADEKTLPVNNCVSWPRTSSNDVDRADADARANQLNLNHCNDIGAATACALAEPKRKPKRKRGQCATGVVVSTKSNNLPVNEGGRNRLNSLQSQQQQPNKSARKKSTGGWDTEFDGAWEMGRDLIREFIVKQNNRNRSCSESEANKFVKLRSVVRDVDDVVNSFEIESNDDIELNLIKMATAVTSNLIDNDQYMTTMSSVNNTDSGSYSSAATISSDMNMLPFIDGNTRSMIFGSEDCTTPETLSSLNETDCHSQRRLYEREVSSESINRLGAHQDCVDASGGDETKYLAAFEAKFNRNVEALWNDAEHEDTTPAAMSLPPSNQDQSFWQNYYKHHYNEMDGRVFDAFGVQVPQQQQQQQKQPQQQLQLQPPHSLPSTMIATGGALGLTSSIWTDNATNNEDDVSFYANAKLWEKDYNAKVEQPLMDDYQNIDTAMVCSGSDFTSNTNTKSLSSQMMLMMTAPASSMGGDTRQMHAFDDVNMFKWSDNATEKPFRPLMAAAALPAHMPEMQNEEKIRRNLFENSYFDDSVVAPSSSTAIDYNMKYEQLHSNANVNISSGQFCEQQLSAASVIVNKVTLANHSSRSGFKAVQPKPKTDHIVAASIVSPDVKPFQSQPSIEEENLLTSERTHFRPIKQTYQDGHTFEISDELDEINYERSASGTMYLDSEVYREYYVYDDEGNGGSRFQMANKSATSSSAAAAMAAPFVLKYCVKQNEKSCQTDVVVPQPQSHGQLKKLTQYRTEMLQRGRRNEVTSGQLASEMGDDADEQLSTQRWSWAENRNKCNNNNNAHALWEHCATCSNDVVVSMPANRLLKDELSADGDEIMTDLKYMRNLYIGSDWEDDDDVDDDVDGDGDGNETETMADDYDDHGQLMMQLPTKNATKLDGSNGMGVGVTVADKATDNANDDDDHDDGYSDTQTNNVYYNHISKLISELLQPETARTLVQAISEKCAGNSSNNGRINHSHLGRLTNNDNNTDNHNVTADDVVDVGVVANNCRSDGGGDGNNNNDSGNGNGNDAFFGSLWDNNDNSIWRKQPPNNTNGSIWSNATVANNHTNGIAYDANMNSIDQGMANRNYEHLKMAYENTWEHSNLEQLWSSTVAQNHPPIDTFSANTANQHRKRIRDTNDDQSMNAAAKLLSFINEPNRMDSFNFDASINVKSCLLHHHEKCLAKNRSDRKRRHSATSQNVFETSLSSCAFAQCEASNRHKKLPSATNIIMCRYLTLDATCFRGGNIDMDFDFDCENHNNNNNNNDSTGDDFNSSLDYQTQCFPSFANHYQSTGINAPLHPTSILKHVAAMVARPLTR